MFHLYYPVIASLYLHSTHLPNVLNFMPCIRCLLAWRALQLAAACSAGRRARGNGSGCGSSSKTRCSTPSQPVRWGGTESPTPAPKHSHDHSNTTPFSLKYHQFLCRVIQCMYFHISTSPHRYCLWHIKGLSALSLFPLYNCRSEYCTALFLLQHEARISYSTITAYNRIGVYNLDTCALRFFRIKWLQRVYLCKALPSSWPRGRRERRAATCSISTTRRPSTTHSGLKINKLHAGQHRPCSWQELCILYI